MQTELFLFLYTDDDAVGAVGVAYDPEENDWRQLARSPLDPLVTPKAIWTGKEILLLSGSGDRPGGTGNAAFDPSSDTWRPIAPPHAAGFSTDAPAWTGRGVLFFGSQPVEFVAATGDWLKLPEPPGGARMSFGIASARAGVMIWGGRLSGTADVASDALLYAIPSD